MKKLFLHVLIGIMALNLVSCLPAGSNMTEMASLAVVSYNTKEEHRSILTVIYGYGSEIAVPELESADLKIGDCILARYTIDWDNQPESASIDYATNIIYLLVEQSYPSVQNDFDETEAILPDADLLPIQAITPQAYHPILGGKFFLYFNHSAPSRQEMDYTAIVKPSNTPNKPVDLYLIGEKKNKPEGSNTNFDNPYVIDMRRVIEELGKDTLFKESSVEYTIRQLQVNLKYCTGLDEDDVPQYEDYNPGTNATFTFSLFM